MISPRLDVGLAQLVLHAFDDAVGDGFEGVLKLYLHDELRAALQVKPELDVLSKFLAISAPDFGMPITP